MSFFFASLGVATVSLSFAVTLLVLYALFEILPRYLKKRGGKDASISKTAAHYPISAKDEDSDPFHITPLPSFNWQDTAPLKFRAFKPKYHLTMGTSNTHLTNLIEMDRNYLSRLALRKQIIQDHHDIAIQASPAAKGAVDELYTWIVNIYLPTRFPTMFTLTSASLLNLVTNSHLPLEPPTDPVRTLEILGENLDEDFLVLLKSEDGDGYVLAGYVTCFPAGFNTKEKFGLKLRDIHKPVPGYKAKLERSMDKVFERLEVGQMIQRSNWSISENENLYAASGENHLYEGQEVVQQDIDLDKTHLRCERQLLHRLPLTKALVFNFKTYMYPIRDIKHEGLGEELAQAIDGLKEGSVPEMHFYKRGVVWGEAVKGFLRS